MYWYDSDMCVYVRVFMLFFAQSPLRVRHMFLFPSRYRTAITRANFLSSLFLFPRPSLSLCLSFPSVPSFLPYFLSFFSRFYKLAFLLSRTRFESFNETLSLSFPLSMRRDDMYTVFFFFSFFFFFFIRIGGFYIFPLFLFSFRIFRSGIISIRRDRDRTT